MQLRLHAFDLPLRHTFTISRGSMDAQPTLIVELEAHGQRGFGEATTNDYYGATLENMSAALRSVEQDLGSHELTDPAALWDQLNNRLGAHPFAQCALDQAAWDLFGKLQQKPVHELWGLTVDDLPLSNYTIGIDSIDKMVAKMNEFGDWP